MLQSHRDTYLMVTNKLVNVYFILNFRALLLTFWLNLISNSLLKYCLPISILLLHLHDYILTSFKACTPNLQLLTRCRHKRVWNSNIIHTCINSHPHYTTNELIQKITSHQLEQISNKTLLSSLLCLNR